MHFLVCPHHVAPMAVGAGPPLADQSQHAARLALSVTAAGPRPAAPSSRRPGRGILTPRAHELRDRELVRRRQAGRRLCRRLLLPRSVRARFAFPFANGACSRRTHMARPRQPRSPSTMSRCLSFTTLTGESPGHLSRAASPHTRRIAAKFASTELSSSRGGFATGRGW